MKRRTIILAGACIMTSFGIGQATAADGGALVKATFAGGCFWCTEAVYAQLKGVKSVASGYIGGQVPNPTYKQVCTGLTGHAEAIEIEYDPQQVSFEKLLEVFFATHDPTTLNRQGADVGTQYRSGVFYHDDEQKRIAEEVIAKLDAARVFPGKIVTEVTPASRFYPAEDYHQDYFANNPFQPYCQAVAAPKVEKVRKVFKDLVR
jgi:peptide-methionine (S)-S-oxide reductase